MKIFAFFGIFFFILLTSCQNRNQVTHNKRKYRKGYYKPSRAKVKHKKSKKEEEYAYQSESKRKVQSEKQSSAEKKSSEKEQPKSPNNVLSENSNEKSGSNNQHTKDAAPSNSDDDFKTNPKREQDAHEPKRKITDNRNVETKRANWVFWLSLIFYILLSLGVIVSLFIIESAIIIISVFLAIAIILIGLNIWNIIRHKKSPENRIIRGASITIIALLFAFLVLAVIILMLIIKYL